MIQCECARTAFSKCLLKSRIHFTLAHSYWRNYAITGEHTCGNCVESQSTSFNDWWMSYAFEMSALCLTLERFICDTRYTISRAYHEPKLNNSNIVVKIDGFRSCCFASWAVRLSPSNRLLCWCPNEVNNAKIATIFTQSLAKYLLICALDAIEPQFTFDCCMGIFVYVALIWSIEPDVHCHMKCYVTTKISRQQHLCDWYLLFDYSSTSTRSERTVEQKKDEK